MSFDMRRRESFMNEGDDPGPSPDLGAGQAGQGAEELLSAGDDIIDRVLSRDSDRFLSSSRQHGGQ